MALFAGGVALSSAFIFPFVRQEFIPGNVDEAEFEVSFNAPEGTSLSAMDEALRAVESEIKQARGVKSVHASAGGGYVGGVNQADFFVRLLPHEERVFGFGRIWHEAKNFTPWKWKNTSGKTSPLSFTRMYGFWFFRNTSKRRIFHGATPPPG